MPSQRNFQVWPEMSNTDHNIGILHLAYTHMHTGSIMICEKVVLFYFYYFISFSLNVKKIALHLKEGLKYIIINSY